MKIVTFQGGIGNQMFQYQFYLWLKTHTPERIWGYFPAKGLKAHNGLEVDKCFENVLLPPTNILICCIAKVLKVLERIKLKKTVSRADCFDLEKVVFEDYWLDLNYFTSFRFDFNVSMLKNNTKNIEILKQINLNQSVAIHVRRGDYVSAKYFDLYAGVCDANYYKKAIDYVSSLSNTVVFYVFSDDIAWVSENLSIPNAIFVDWNKAENSCIDLYLMSQCKMNIIANSTFSWWAAYNGSNREKTVVAPKRWFGSSKYTEPNIFPETWIRL